MRALITGVTGQDGHYLSQYLQHLGYTVYGLVRHTSAPARVPQGVQVIEGDVTDLASLQRALQCAAPAEVYNLAAQSFVETSFKAPLHTADVNAIGAHNVLEAVKQVPPSERPRVYQAGTSEMFGGVSGAISETTPFHPRSPYACAKVYAHHTAVHYREAHGMFVCNGILFNHESPLRGEQFVTQKIAKAAARIACGSEEKLILGTLTATRDWGFAGDYVKAMHLMLQAPEPDDYVIGTGESHSVLEWLDRSFAVVGLNYEDHVVTDPEYAQRRPSEVFHLRADAGKAGFVLGWKPEVRFEALVDMMVEAAMAREVGA